MPTPAICLKILSKRKHSVWLQKMSETTYVADVQDFRDQRERKRDRMKSHVPAGLWRGKIYRGTWHYGTYTEVLNALVLEADG